MFFDVAGLIIAVPLIELGGIHKTDKTNSLMGKPDWFKGVMLYRDEKINVVDTALWVMPEKCDEKLKNSLNYQYIIMLNDSPWGLSAENLVDTVVLKQDEVKWLDSTNKRPWLAGLVKDKMCALLDVSALIQLLDEGSNIYQDK
jgi:purine-binding chemotaxis protein CheW